MVCLLAAHVMNSVGVWLAHRLLHLPGFGAVHARVHHGSASGWRAQAGEHGVWACLVIGHLGIAVWLLPSPLDMCLLADAAVSGPATYVLHTAFDRPDTRLRRYRWFQRARDAHRRHHRTAHLDFHRCGWFAFGLPPLGFLFDRLAGTDR